MFPSCFRETSSAHVTDLISEAMDNPALRARYDGYDRNGDGRLELSELGQLLDELGAGYDETQVKAAFEAIDLDHDGEIDFQEFSHWWVD